MIVAMSPKVISNQAQVGISYTLQRSRWIKFNTPSDVKFPCRLADLIKIKILHFDYFSVTPTRKDDGDEEAQCVRPDELRAVQYVLPRKGGPSYGGREDEEVHLEPQDQAVLWQDWGQLVWVALGPRQIVFQYRWWTIQKCICLTKATEKNKWLWVCACVYVWGGRMSVCF